MEQAPPQAVRPDKDIPLTPLDRWIAAKIGPPAAATPPDPVPSATPAPGSFPVPSLDRAALLAYQLAKLRETVALARERSPFYRRHLSADAAALYSLEDLRRVPFTTADDLRAAPLSFLCVKQDEVERIVTLPTSGTTGTPKRVFFTAEDQESTRDFFHRGMSTLVEPGDRVLILLPGHIPGSVGALLEEGLARMGVAGIQHGPVTDPMATLEIMTQERVTALVGIPVQILALAKTWAARQAGRPPLHIRAVLLSTDLVPQSVVRTLEASWGCTVFNHYGTTEMGLGGGVDCRALAGYHLREADMLFEVVDPMTGESVPDGTPGEVIFTTLTRQAMPLIRYRTGDISRFLPGPCPCGTCLRRLEHVRQRVKDDILLPGGRSLRQIDFDEALLGLPGVTDFTVSFPRDAKSMHLDIQVLTGKALPPPDESTLLEAVHGIPSLRESFDRPRIRVTIEGNGTGIRENAGTAKRRISFF